MITRLDVLLEISPEEFDYNTGSVLHGLLMEEADSAYVDYLHESAMNPFSQMVFRNDKNQVVWRINTLDKAAEENIINLIENKQRLFIKKRNKEIAINKISKQTFSYKELISKYYGGQDAANIINIKILTPVAFKIQGTYQILPDFKYIYRNIMNRFDLFSEEYNIFDREALEHLVNHTQIVGYRLRSTRFYVEKTKIPSFLGDMTIKITGAKTMQNLTGLLFDYAQYSGIGIKTSLGMGGCEKK